MISIKSGGKKGTDAKVKGMQTEVLLAMVITNELLLKMFKKDLTLTSVTDSHTPPSLHPKGQAFDMRIWGISGVEQVKFKSELSQLLGDEYDVVIEKDHIHVEFDPKEEEFDPKVDPEKEVEEELSPINLTSEEAQMLLKETYEDEERFGEDESTTRLRRIERKAEEILAWVRKQGREGEE